MGEKSRGNFSINFCMQTMCANRGKRCDMCIRQDQLRYRRMGDYAKKDIKQRKDG